MNILIASTALAIGEVTVISCTVNDISADSIRLLRDNQTVAEIRRDTQLNIIISVNDSLHESVFLCEAQLTRGTVTVYSTHIQVTVKGNDTTVVKLCL